MSNKRTIFIWDIHGCYDEFKLLIKKLDIQPNDIVYLVWDIINKGPKSFKVLNFIYKNRDQYKCILWNHEVWFLNYIDGWDIKYESFKQLEKEIKKKNPELIWYLKSLPTYIETNDFLMIHGWLIPWKKPCEHELDEITRLREYRWKPWHSYYTWDKLIIYGHWAVQWFHRTHNTIWLDTWCLYGKKLTAYILEEDKFIYQKALKQYRNPFWDYKWIKSWYKWILHLIK